MGKSKIGKFALYLFLLLAVSFFITSCDNNNSDVLEKAKSEKVASPLAGGAVVSDKNSALLQQTVIVYYFHGNFRCASCHRIEQYTKEAVEQYFSDELRSGRLVFSPINVEKQGNEHFVKDYQLYTKSVVLSLVKNEAEIKHINLEKVWNYLGNKEQFFSYIKSEVEEYLGELQ